MAASMDRKRERVAQELARLALLDRAGCLEVWHDWFGFESPRYLSAVFMRKALAHEAQCRILGRLPAGDMRALRSIANGKRSALRVTPDLSAGTHLVREWNGRTYQIEVTASGYVMDGKAYRSLTAIAKRITGANWSGPRFFGLIDRSGKQREVDRGQAATDHASDTALTVRFPDLPDSMPLELDVTDPDDSGSTVSASLESATSSSCQAEASGHV